LIAVVDVMKSLSSVLRCNVYEQNNIKAAVDKPKND